jgi:hypothetical protein
MVIIMLSVNFCNISPYDILAKKQKRNLPSKLVVYLMHLLLVSVVAQMQLVYSMHLLMMSRHHHRVRVWACDRANNIKGVINISYPITHCLIK